MLKMAALKSVLAFLLLGVVSTWAASIGVQEISSVDSAANTLDSLTSSLDGLDQPQMQGRDLSNIIDFVRMNVGAIKAGAIGTFFGPLGSFVTAYIQPPISHGLSYLTGGILARSSDGQQQAFVEDPARSLENGPSVHNANYFQRV